MLLDGRVSGIAMHVLASDACPCFLLPRPDDERVTLFTNPLAAPIEAEAAR
jgi:hypothetical protein